MGDVLQSVALVGATTACLLNSLSIHRILRRLENLERSQRATQGDGR
jgi:hypothetical protein